MKQVDLAIVGAGILGLAHAVHAALAGLSVAVFERSPAADGASVRNFGMLAIAAQAQGRQMADARRALHDWLYVARRAGVSMRQPGCLFLARNEVEMAVLEEYAASDGIAEQSLDVLTGRQLHRCAANLRSDTVVGGVWSPEVWKVDQRQAMSKIADWLAREHGVSFQYCCEVLSVTTGRVETTSGSFGARQIVVCGGDEFGTLFPEEFRQARVGRCRLQMLRTRPQPGGWELPPFIVGGLSLPRYAAFAGCPSLPFLVELQQKTCADLLAHGIHVIAGQEPDGSITIGDSHAYDDALDEQRSQMVDQLILEELAAMISLPDPHIADRWLGHYAHLPDAGVLKLSPEPGVTAITVTNGQGMTHGFAIAADLLSDAGFEVGTLP